MTTTTKVRYTTVRFEADAMTVSLTMDGLTAVAVEYLQSHGYGTSITDVCRAAVEHLYSRLIEDGYVEREGDIDDQLNEIAERFDMTRGAVLKAALITLWGKEKF